MNWDLNQVVVIVDFEGILFREGEKRRDPNMSVLTSYNPLYPLTANFWVSGSLADLFQFDMTQFMIGQFGKAKTFLQLQLRYEQVWCMVWG